MTEFFAKIVNNVQLLTIFAKSSIVGSGSVSNTPLIVNFEHEKTQDSFEVIKKGVKKVCTLVREVLGILPNI